MNRPDLLYTFTKINLWRLTPFRKIVYVDSDVVALRAPDELFDIKDNFAAAPDVGWPDAFNTGVMVLSPHSGDYHALKTLAGAGDSFDGADQGLLNQYFEHKPWKRLSFMYNCTPSANYQYEPAYRYYKSNISMVHFIGSNKPWQQGRSANGASGAYQELLSRWWAVYDRHFHVSTSDYALTGQRESTSDVVQKEVKGESQTEGYYATGYPLSSTSPSNYQPAEASAITTEAPFTDTAERAESIDQGLIQPLPTSEARRFSAPHMEWDATQSAPPAESKPEAVNFPTQTYEFSNDPAPFRPPASYPEAPRDMYYEVPKTPPKQEKPAPIFPWEEREMPKPTRKFVDDEPLPPPPPSKETEPEMEFHGMNELGVKSDVEPATLTIKINDRTPWDAFGAVNKNAWDDVSGIDSYVRALTKFQKNRGKIEVLKHETGSPVQPAPGEQTHILSPTNEPSADELVEQVQKRRESLLLTDFPSAVERPSLPVTPAPVRRSNFWGSERDEEGELPPAEGVPSQADWVCISIFSLRVLIFILIVLQDPNAQLEQLRRNSLLGPNDLKLPAKKNIPDRKMPSTAASIPEEALGHPHVPMEASAGVDISDARPKDVQQSIPEALPLRVGGEEATAAVEPKSMGMGLFQEPKYGEVGGNGVEVERVEILSPTQTQAGNGSTVAES